MTSIEERPLSKATSVNIDPDTGYFSNIEEIKDKEYPFLQDTTYLDHAGTTLYAKSLVEAYTKDLTSQLFGNPHSASASSQLSSRRIDDTRLQILRFFNADPEDFDVVFVANATAAIKLVADAFRDHDTGFWYGYHADSHTSLVGVRELATQGNRCFRDEAEVEQWISELENTAGEESPEVRLFAYPGQSNMTGNRPPLRWCRALRNVSRSLNRSIYTLYDAAGLLATSPLDLSDDSLAPDFTALSFYKIFGFPDLGALIVRKASADMLRQRKFFGGGTVEMVTTLDQQWHAKKSSSLHSCLEDGTLPFHNIIALQSALSIHERLYGSMRNISRHCHYLAARLRGSLANIRHSSGGHVCRIYSSSPVGAESLDQCPLVAFNLLDYRGSYVPKSEVEKLAIVNNIQLRTGGLCNPGGIARHLDLSPQEMRRNFAAGQRCGDDNDVLYGKPTGAIRLSLGAMSSLKDVMKFVSFLEEFYVDRTPMAMALPIARNECLSITGTSDARTAQQHNFVIESLSVYPIKSCGAFKIPPETAWEVGEKGLAWDREWCLVHQGTGAALSQKKYPRMALLKPTIDLQRRLLIVECASLETDSKILNIGLDATANFAPGALSICNGFTRRESNVCGSNVDVQFYTSVEVATFFTEALGVPCTLARFPNLSIRRVQPRTTDAFPSQNSPGSDMGKSIALANESPILLISRSSVNRLNECIKQNNKTGGVGKAVPADAFRGNIVIAEEIHSPGCESPYIEDEWKKIRIGNQAEVELEVLGSCQRCQMVCVDQKSAQRGQEPLSTLAKTRKREGRVWFGVHLCLVEDGPLEGGKDDKRWIRIGDRVWGETME